MQTGSKCFLFEQQKRKGGKNICLFRLGIDFVGQLVTWILDRVRRERVPLWQVVSDQGREEVVERSPELVAVLLGALEKRVEKNR